MNKKQVEQVKIVAALSGTIETLRTGRGFYDFHIFLEFFKELPKNSALM